MSEPSIVDRWMKDNPEAHPPALLPKDDLRLMVRDKEARRIAKLIVPIARDMASVKAASRISFNTERARILIHAIRYHLPNEIEGQIDDPVVRTELNRIMSAVSHIPDHLIDDQRANAAYGAMFLVMLATCQMAVSYFDLHVWVQTENGEVDALREILSGLSVPALPGKGPSGDGTD